MQIKLTPREQEVLGLVKQGLTDKEIAEELVWSKRTVGYYVGLLLGKFGAKNRTELSIKYGNIDK